MFNKPKIDTIETLYRKNANGEVEKVTTTTWLPTTTVTVIRAVDLDIHKTTLQAQIVAVDAEKVAINNAH